ncbi:hypothetical protein H2248_009386 [Termitomyces sp. 'cryptogamus']|nr:hypothetical protein H2248_009386 [Termitomyces sp. 'cryptogamus']
MNDDEVEYEVENITQARVEKEKGRKKNLIWKYRVRWKGYGPNDDTWEPQESFVGSEHIIEQFWERANSGGRDYRDMGLFKVGEEFVLTGPPRRKPKRQSVKPAPVVASQLPPEASNNITSETSPMISDKRKRSLSVTEIQNPDDEVRPNKRVREDKEVVESLPKSPILLPERSGNYRNTSQLPLPAKARTSPRKLVRSSPFDEVIPASDDEPANPYDTEDLKANSRNVTTSTDILETSDDGHGHVGTTVMSEEHSREFAMDTDDSPDHPTVDSPNSTTKLPAHRAKAANPKVKITELDYAAPQGALSVKARLSGRGVSTSSVKGSSSHRVKAGSGSKPGPGRSSAGFMKKNTSSLLTFEKGELKTVKGHYNKEVHEKNQGSESYDQAEDSPTGSLWGGDDDIANDDGPDSLNAAPPTANELLHLAGADLASEPLPDFEEDPSAIVLVSPDSPPTASDQLVRDVGTDLPLPEPQQDSSRPAHWESLQRAKNNLFPSNAISTSQVSTSLWKQPTMFGPLGFGLNSRPNEGVASDIAHSSPFFININSSVSIPVILTDVAPSHPGSPSLEFIIAKRGPPGVFYSQSAALVLLDTLRTGGPSAKIGLHPSANLDHKNQFEQFRSRLSAGELYAGMAGDEFLAFCSSDDSLLSQRLNICPQLLGHPGDIFVERVVIENYSAYAEAALAGIEGSPASL